MIVETPFPLILGGIQTKRPGAIFEAVSILRGVLGVDIKALLYDVKFIPLASIVRGVNTPLRSILRGVQASLLKLLADGALKLDSTGCWFSLFCG